MKCAACAETFQCGMEGAQPCWCATSYPHALPVPGPTQACYCPRCLAREIEAQRTNEKRPT
ncbi:MAG: hypothetical protein EXR36_12365 [Betaproteobacteria bacterium]|nr:hypothetical protein [Betaproteobacteria bacterium]